MGVMLMRRRMAGLVLAALLCAGWGPVGVEYGHSGIVGDDESAAVLAAATGSTTVKFTDVFWHDIQPWDFATWCSIWPFSAWSNCNYQWAELDADVRTWQAAGFDDIHMVLRSKHPAFTARTVPVEPAFSLYANLASAPPKPDRWDDYGAFVGAVAERYDGDGKSDMPGLRWPIHGYEPESEQQITMWWAGTVDEHLRLARAARAAILRADPLGFTILGGVNFSNNLDDSPTEEAWRARVNGLPQPWRTIVADGIVFAEKELQAPDVFDKVDLHALSNDVGARAGVAFLRDKMLANGYFRDIWVGDATTAPEMLYNQKIGAVPYLPKGELAQKAAILFNPSAPAYAATVAWLRAEQASLTARKFAMALASGAKRINFASPIDWPTISSLPFNGILESDGRSRPVAATLNLLVAASSACAATGDLPPADDVPALTWSFESGTARGFAFANRCGGRFAIGWSTTGTSSMPLPWAPVAATRIPTSGADGLGVPVPFAATAITLSATPVILR